VDIDQFVLTIAQLFCSLNCCNTFEKTNVEQFSFFSERIFKVFNLVLKMKINDFHIRLPF